MQKYPTLTLTFVYREVQALRAAGFDIDTFSIWKPRAGELSAEARPLVAETFYIFPLNLLRFVACHLRYGLTRPRRYWGALAFCLSRDHGSLGRVTRVVGHFLQAGYLAAEVERRGIRHLHAHFARNSTTLALVAGRLTGVTFSFTAHANDLYAAPTLLADKIREASFIIAISVYNREFLYRVVPATETLAKTYIVRYGLDVRRFARQTGRAAQHADRPPVILGVGRLVEKKGFPYLVQACQLLAGRGHAFRCVIVGQGPQAGELRRMIAAAGLGERVHLVGAVFQEQLREYLEQARVFVLPCVVAQDGDRDGIPNALIEAMALEIPTVSTRVSGIPELIEHEVTGLLVPPRDAPALADALGRLLDEPELRRRLGPAGRAKVLADYDIDKNTAALLRIFRMALGSAPVQAAQGQQVAF